nr:acyl carrier protein [Micromonospora sp. DSM 115978]
MDHPDVATPVAVTPAETTGPAGTTTRDGEIAQKVVTMLAEMVRRDPATITAQTRLFDDLAFDSTSVLELLMQLEDTLGTEVDPFTVVPSDFETVGSLVEYALRQTDA